MVLGVCTDYIARAIKSGGDKDKKLTRQIPVTGSLIYKLKEKTD